MMHQSQIQSVSKQNHQIQLKFLKQKKWNLTIKMFLTLQKFSNHFPKFVYPESKLRKNPQYIKFFKVILHNFHNFILASIFLLLCHEIQYFLFKQFFFCIVIFCGANTVLIKNLGLFTHFFWF